MALTLTQKRPSLHHTTPWTVDQCRTSRGKQIDGDAFLNRGNQLLAGVLRGRLIGFPQWDDFKECVISEVKQTVTNDGGDPLTFQNDAKSFGAADSNPPHRWVMPTHMMQCTQIGAFQTALDIVTQDLIPSLLQHSLTTRGGVVDGVPLMDGQEMSLIRSCIFIDPTGSKQQTCHNDINSPELENIVGKFNIWNIMLPVQTVPGHPETCLEVSDVKLPPLCGGVHDIHFFDGMCDHYGGGNNTGVPRILLQFTFMQTRLLQHPMGRKHISEQFQPAANETWSDGSDLSDQSTLVGHSVFGTLQHLASENRLIGLIGTPSPTPNPPSMLTSGPPAPAVSNKRSRTEVVDLTGKEESGIIDLTGE